MVYLLGEGVLRGDVSVALAVDGGVGAPSNGVHYPVGVVVVHDMEGAVPAPGTKGRSILLLDREQSQLGLETGGDSDPRLYQSVSTWAFSGSDLPRNG